VDSIVDWNHSTRSSALRSIIMSTVHVVALKIYFAVFAALMVLTATTVAIAFVDLGPFNNVVALVIACTKASLVILFFMHVRYSERLIQLSVAVGLLFVLILMAFTLAEPMTRAWVRPVVPWVR
jgi:cytochrome c oxidase subunit 4